MLTLKGAWLQVFFEIRRKYGFRQGWNELVIIDEQVFEVIGGWVFPYTTRGCLAGIPQYTIGGNSPIFIDRYTCEMSQPELSDLLSSRLSLAVTPT